MPDPTPTPNYGWVLPQVDGDNNAWGTELNDFFRDIDADVFAVSEVANAAAVTSQRVKISPNANQNVAADTDVQLSFTGPTSAYNVGSWGVSATGLTVPSDAAGLLVLTAQVGFGVLLDPSSDANAKIKVWIEGTGGIVGEQWAQLDAQNASSQGMRIQVTGFVNSPNPAQQYVVKVRTPAGVGTVAVLSANTWFAGHMVK
jgi:hypothetical protein